MENKERFTVPASQDLGPYCQRERRPELPVLFLDVDGVLNCEQDFRDGHMLCQRKILMLNHLPDCDVVISSAWRIGTYDHLIAALKWLGLKHGVIGRTDSSWSVEIGRAGDRPICKSSMRGEEIAKWLSENDNPNFAIVDDDADMLPEQSAHFVNTDFMDGLTHGHVRRLSQILKTPIAKAAE